jgi:flagellar basal-body rod protein FlgF
MDPIGVAAASGMRARMESLEVLANNLANSTTSGFKADREAYGLFVGPEASGGAQGPLTVPVTERTWTDFTQGPLQTTGKSTDLALSGRGFFVLGGQGTPSYTRAGSFRVAPTGVLESGDGRPVLDTLNRPIRLAPNSDIHITGTGEVHQNGAAVGQLRLVEFPRPEALVKEGSNTFALPAGAPAEDQPAVARQAQVYQGYLEAPNVHAAESAVRMIHVLRQFESLQRAMTMTSEMNQKILDEVVKSHG